MEGSPESALIDTKGKKGATWLPQDRVGLLSLHLGCSFLGTFQGKARPPSFHLREEVEQDTLPTESRRQRRGLERCAGWFLSWDRVQAAPCEECSVRFSHSVTRGSVLLALPVVPRGTWSEVVWPGLRVQTPGSFDSLGLHKFLWVLGSLDPKQHRIAFIINS